MIGANLFNYAVTVGQSLCNIFQNNWLWPFVCIVQIRRRLLLPNPLEMPTRHVIQASC